MRRMKLLPVAALLATLLIGVAGCRHEEPALPSTCTKQGAIAAALRAAPAPVKLADGTRLSTCVDHARDDGQIQTVGAVYTRVADGLAHRMQSDRAAATQLGYLIGAAQRGARRSNGIHLELVRRLEQSLGVSGPPPAHRSAFQNGLATGLRGG